MNEVFDILLVSIPSSSKGRKGTNSEKWHVKSSKFMQLKKIIKKKMPFKTDAKQITSPKSNTPSQIKS